MKTIKQISFLLLTSLALFSCSKGGDGGGSTPPPPQEANLTITTNPANNAVVPAAVGTTFPVTINVTSTMPSQGVRIEVTAAPEAGGASFFTSNTTSSNASNTITINNTPAQVSCVVNIRVSSVARPSNAATSSYRYSRKN
ncbi:hypothetical protein ACWATR_39970 [Nostoc sp. UIC 10890]